jgi:hypothetical protein
MSQPPFGTCGDAEADWSRHLARGNAWLSVFDALGQH